jgi:hypothetical protein
MSTRWCDMSASLIDRVRERLAAESAALRPNVVAAAIRAESGGVLGDTEVLNSLRVLQTEPTGAGILEQLLCADGTTDILVTAPDAVWVDDGNGLRRSSIRFADEAAVRRLALQRLAPGAGRRLDEAQPWVDGQRTGVGTGQFTVRWHTVLPPMAHPGLPRRRRPCTPTILPRCVREGVIMPGVRRASSRGRARARFSAFCPCGAWRFASLPSACRVSPDRSAPARRRCRRGLPRRAPLRWEPSMPPGRQTSPCRVRLG